MGTFTSVIFITEAPCPSVKARNAASPLHGYQYSYIYVFRGPLSSSWNPWGWNVSSVGRRKFCSLNNASELASDLQHFHGRNGKEREVQKHCYLRSQVWEFTNHYLLMRSNSLHVLVGFGLICAATVLWHLKWQVQFEVGVLFNFGSLRTACDESPTMSHWQSIKQGVFETQWVLLQCSQKTAMTILKRRTQRRHLMPWEVTFPSCLAPSVLFLSSYWL